MIIDKFKTPVGHFKVYKNSEKSSFFIQESTNNKYWLNGDIRVHPQGCYKIIVDLINFTVGDIIICEIDNGELDNDGGGENALNIVGKVGDYIIGIGAPDSDALEESYHPDRWSKDMNHTKYVLPYEVLDITKRGYIFKIKDKPEEYRDKNFRKHIELSLVWEHKDKEYAWDIVSFLTS